MNSTLRGVAWALAGGWLLCLGGCASMGWMTPPLRAQWYFQENYSASTDPLTHWTLYLAVLNEDPQVQRFEDLQVNGLPLMAPASVTLQPGQLKIWRLWDQQPASSAEASARLPPVLQTCTLPVTVTAILQGHRQPLNLTGTVPSALPAPWIRCCISPRHAHSPNPASPLFSKGE